MPLRKDVQDLGSQYKAPTKLEAVGAVIVHLHTCFVNAPAVASEENPVAYNVA